MKTFLTAAIIMLAPCAQAADSTRIYEEKGLYVETNPYPSGQKTCDAGTKNSYGETFSLILTEEGEFMIYMGIIAARKALHRTGQAEVLVQIDYAPWALHDAQIETGQEADVMFLTSQLSNKTEKSFHNLWQGNAIFLKTPSGSRTLKSQSLSGSAAALDAHVKCAKHIVATSGSY